jgi:hypothetical protein
MSVTEELCKLKLERMLKDKHKVSLSFMGKRELRELIDEVYEICREDFQRDTSRG